MTATTPPIQSASLYFREGNSDKEYRAAIEPRADGFVVTFAYGRRGGTLNAGTKTQAPVSLNEATKVFNRLVAAKVAKGYRFSNETGAPTTPYRQTGTEGNDSGIRCQLLNPIEEDLRLSNREGVVFKDMDAPFIPGRPNSGGPQLKFKFVESASFVVTDHNAKRSVTLGLYDGDKLVPAGNVTIPPNHAIPQKGTVVETRYLYAFKESGSIYQPVYLGPRTDIPAAECGVDQLKYKAEAEAEATA